MTEAVGRAGRWALAGQARGARVARRRACVGARAGAAGSWARRRGAQWVRRRAERHGRGRQARELALGCALGLFVIRFDSVFFLSQFLDIVREPGS